MAGDAAVPVVSAARAARTAGSADDRLVPGSSGGSSRSRSSNDNARKDNSGNISSRSSDDNARKDNSWRDATCARILLPPFDPGKRCLRRMRRRIAVLGVALPFDRGKEWGANAAWRVTGCVLRGVREVSISLPAAHLDFGYSLNGMV